LVHHPDALVVNELVEIALLPKRARDALVPPHWPVVLRDKHLRIGAELLERLADEVRPPLGVAYFGPSERQQIVQRVRGVFRKVEHLGLREEEVHLGRRL